MADVNLSATLGIGFYTAAKLVAFTCGVNRIKYFAKGGTNEILWQLGAVLSPVGFHDAGGLVVGC